jgi:twinkle protein
MRRILALGGARHVRSIQHIHKVPLYFMHLNPLSLPSGTASIHASSHVCSGNAKAFVSKYYEIDDHRIIQEFLRRKGMVLKETPTHYIVRDCPFCHPTKGRSDNLFKLYVSKTSGVYLCHRCGASGSWFGFKEKVQ